MVSADAGVFRQVTAQVSVSLSGYMLAAPWSGATANYSYPLYADMGASVQDHFINWKVRPFLMAP